MFCMKILVLFILIPFFNAYPADCRYNEGSPGSHKWEVREKYGFVNSGSGSVRRDLDRNTTVDGEMTFLDKMKTITFIKHHVGEGGPKPEFNYSIISKDLLGNEVRMSYYTDENCKITKIDVDQGPDLPRFFVNREICEKALKTEKKFDPSLALQGSPQKGCKQLTSNTILKACKGHGEYFAPEQASLPLTKEQAEGAVRRQ